MAYAGPPASRFMFLAGPRLWLPWMNQGPCCRCVLKGAFHAAAPQPAASQLASWRGLLRSWSSLWGQGSPSW